jgi:hypothetical protein
MYDARKYIGSDTHTVQGKQQSKSCQPPSCSMCGSYTSTYMQDLVAGSPDRLRIKRESRLFVFRPSIRSPRCAPLKRHRVQSSHPCCVSCTLSESVIVDCFRVTTTTYHRRKSETNSRILVRMLFCLASLPLEVGFAKS